MKNKRQSGEVVVEATIVVTLVMILITVMLYIGMILYQQTLVSVMANQTASNIAQIYSNNLKDPFTGYVEPNSVYQSVTYNNMKSDAYLDVVEQKANVFAQYRLKSSRILSTGISDVEVKIAKKPNELLKSQIIVTIRDSYDMPLVGFFGTDSLVEFAAQGRADCVDILEYINGVEAIGDPEDSNISYLPGADNCVVTFVPIRANASNSTSVTVMRGKSIISSNRYTHSIMPGTPIYGDFEFAGWKDDGGGSFTASTVVDDDIVVYGEWKCTVKLNAEGGTVNSAGTYTFKTKLNSRANIPDASRSGYNFKGWYTQKNGGGKRYISNDTFIDDNLTLYAHWERRMHTVTFDPNGGYLPSGVSNKVTVVYNNSVSMPTAKRQGYTFDGWRTERNGGTHYTNSTRITKNVTLYANWTKCVRHRLGDCGVTHAVNYKFSWHRTPYYGTTKVRCLVCPDCGTLIDGSGNTSTRTDLKQRCGSSDAIAYYVWCAEHKTRNGGRVADGHITSTSKGSYYIH